MSRRRSRRAAPPPGPSVNITSLSDIMLSLLIFFMLVSKTGVDTGADPELELPIAALGVTQEQIEDERAASNSVVVNVRSGTIQGNPRVYGRYFSTGEEWSFNVRNLNTDQPELRLFLEELKGDRDEFEVFVHAASDTPFYDIESVLQAVNGSRPSLVKYAFALEN
ncbi:MAG: biopolymer transporter ExbD [Planctomycetota bacterium]